MSGKISLIGQVCYFFDDIRIILTKLFPVSYRIDSDIKLLLGRFKDSKTGKVLEPTSGQQRMWEMFNQKDKDLWKIIKKKRKNIAWFDSTENCDSKRRSMIEKLQHFIDVDVYGGCGK
jgi:hypothetical protein